MDSHLAILMGLANELGFECSRCGDSEATRDYYKWVCKSEIKELGGLPRTMFVRIWSGKFIVYFASFSSHISSVFSGCLRSTRFELCDPNLIELLEEELK